MSAGNWGGSAAGGGMEFQAAVSALCMVHMACGIPLGWNDLGKDTPLSLSAETGGAGDDISLTLLDGSITEIQAKKRLRNANDQLWSSLIGLCQRAGKDRSFNGVLAVGPATSLKIRDELARDVIRIGQGRTDDLSALAAILIEKLSAASIPLSACGRVRIQTVHVLEQDGASAQSAVAHLRHISNQPSLAWETLKAEGLRLIKLRGRQDVVSVGRIIPELRTDTSGAIGPTVKATQLLDWTLNATNSFTIPALSRVFSLDDDWIKLKALSQNKPEIGLGNLEEALTHYHEGTSGRRAEHDQATFDAETIGYFVRQCVLVAGPGMGKSQLLRRIARLLARKREPSLLVRLRPLAERMRSGETFLEAVLHIGLDASPLKPLDVQMLGLQNLTLLLDGLDESGTEQEEIAKSAIALAASYPGCRIVFATRPIGYETSILNSWKHYQLVPIESSDARKGIERLVDTVQEQKNTKIVEATAAAIRHLDYKFDNTFSAKSPLMVALLASLALNEIIAAETREGLYGQLFKLIERMTTAQRSASSTTSAVLNAFLHQLGWELSANPYASAEQVISECAQRLAVELRETPLKARSICDDALTFWEKTGIVERVRFKISEALTFVHKTFGEYAAAKYLVSRSESERANLLLTIESEQKWKEVLIFASSMGLGSELVQLALASARADSIEVARLLQWAKHSNNQLKPDLAEMVLHRAWAVITAPHSRQALSIGVKLAFAMTKLPSAEIRSKSYRGHSQWWTSLVGWVCFVKTSPKLLDFVELLTFMNTHEAESDTRTVSGGFDLYNPVRELWKELLISATRELVGREVGSDEQKFINRLKESFNSQSIGFIEEVSITLKEAGIAADFPAMKDLFSTYFAPDYFEQHRKDNLALLNAIVADTDKQDAHIDPPLLHLSAFWYGTGLMNMEISAMSRAARASGEDEAMQIIKLAARFCSYDYNQLIAETKMQIRALKNGDFQLSNLLSVDAPMMWSGNPDSSTRPIISKALLHSSKWIIVLATNLAEHLLTTDDIAELVPYVLSESEGLGTAAAAYLGIRYLGEPRARQLMITRLKQPLNSGCQHIFSYLADIWTEDIDDQINEILTQALTFGPRTAKESLSIVYACSVSHRKGLTPLLKGAYDYWLKNEEPYPSGSGTIPESPRGDILALLIEEAAFNHNDLFEAAKDRRSEVSNQAQTALLKAISLSENLRSELALRLHAGESLESLLTSCLRGRTAFSQQDVKLIVGLLESENPKTRFAAMGILDPQYLSRGEINNCAKKLLRDPYQHLRDEGMQILSMYKDSQHQV